MPNTGKIEPTPAPPTDPRALSDAELLNRFADANRRKSEPTGWQEYARCRAELKRRLSLAATERPAEAHETEESDSTKRVEIEIHHSMILWNTLWKIILEGKATDNQIEAHEALSLAMRKAKK